MSVRIEILGLILACMAVTLLPRVIPMLLAHKINLPRPLQAWLAYIPATVIAALFFKEVLLLDGAWRSWDSPHLGAGFGALVMAIASRSVPLTIVAGLAVFVFMRWLL